MAERDLLKQALELQLPGVKLFRNQVGAAKTLHGTRIQTGLGKGSPDLVGFRSVVIDGKRIAQFVGIELKNPDKTGTISDDQLDYMRNLLAAGGCGGFAQKIEDVIGILMAS